jgi:hypothetical protein
MGPLLSANGSSGTGARSLRMRWLYLSGMAFAEERR